MPRLAVVVDWPNGNVPWPCFASILESDICREPDRAFFRGISPSAELSANAAVKAIINQGYDEIFFISADQTVPRDVLARMRAHNKDIVGALVATRQPGHHWLCFDLGEDGKALHFDPVEPLQKADVIGIGCSLVKADVFKRVPPPWFSSVHTPDGCGLVKSSDFMFFEKCKAAGVGVYIDATMESDHQFDVMLNSSTLCRTAPFLIESRGGTHVFA